MKIYVYAIAKNEEQFCKRWMQSMCEADGVYVLDTGSTDGTAALLKSLGAHVAQETIQPWRFDTARNRSLDLVPADGDVCVCTDLDEVFHPGWRGLLEGAWTGGRLRYSYIWSFVDGRPGVQFLLDKIHARRGYRWAHPVHEVLVGEGPAATEERIVLEHHPDPEKSRGQYLPLLELSVQEDPEDDRNLHYLGREYMFYGRWDKAIETLKAHLRLPKARWKPERCASMRFLSSCYLAKGELDEALAWALYATDECPTLREPWVQGAEAAYAKADWERVRAFAQRALAIQEAPKIYIQEARAWGPYPLDLLAIAAYRLGDIPGAIEATEKALEFGPDQRLEQNLRCYRKEAGR